MPRQIQKEAGETAVLDSHSPSKGKYLCHFIPVFGNPIFVGILLCSPKAIANPQNATSWLLRSGSERMTWEATVSAGRGSAATRGRNRVLKAEAAFSRGAYYLRVNLFIYSVFIFFSLEYIGVVLVNKVIYVRCTIL